MPTWGEVMYKKDALLCERMKRFALVMLVLVVCLLAACSEQQQASVYKIGVSVPLTSSAAQLGSPFLEGLKLAQKEINAQGGVNNKQIKLIVQDNQNSPKEGVNVFHALEVEHPDLIISTMSTATSFSPTRMARSSIFSWRRRIPSLCAMKWTCSGSSIPARIR